MTNRVSDVVAERIQHHRKKLGWSVRELADQCCQVGQPELTEASLGNIERAPTGSRKRREVSVDDLVVLGQVLAVEPLLLMTPIDQHARQDRLDTEIAQLRTRLEQLERKRSV